MKKELNNKIQKFFSSTITIIVAIITFLIGFFAIGKSSDFDIVINFASEKSFIKNDNILLNIFLVLITFGILFFLYKKVLPKINKRILFILMLVFSLSLGIWWINYLKLKPISDQSMVIYCAEKLLDNDLKPILEPGNYLSRNPHQFGFVVYLMAIFKIFNTRNPIYVQNLNVLFSIVCLIIMYFIIKELFEEDIIHKLATLFIAFFSIYFVFFSPHVYGNISGLAFGLISVLFTLKFVDSNKIWHLVIIAISITISYLLKSNYEIFLIAIIIELVLKAIRDLKIKSVLGVLGIIAVVFGTKTLIYTCFEKITGYPLDNGVPVTSYIYMGIAEPVTLTPGWYTGDVETIYNQSGYDKNKSKEITNELMSNRLDYLSSNPKYTYEYFNNKLQTTWLNPTFQTIWCSTPSIVLDLSPDYNAYISGQKLLISIICGKASNLEKQAMDIFQIIIFLSASFALFINFKDGSLKKMLLPIIFLGGFTFHLIWETKAIYVLQYFYLLVPYAVYGIYKLFYIIDNKIKSILLS